MLLKRICFLKNIVYILILVAASLTQLNATSPTPPNIVMVFIDDMGWGDLGCYGNPDIKTPNIDRLASQGILFEQFYVASPICSPSRVAVTTGQYPARHKINSYLNSRQKNAARGMANFLDPGVPAIARSFESAGYATAHFGKWHMGGGRDVDDAPLPQSYGFQESLTSFEGLGDRILQANHGLSAQSAKLGQGTITYVEKHKNTQIYVDRSIDFISRNSKKPFYLHLWLNDVHDPFKPTTLQLQKFQAFAGNKYLQQYYAVIDEMDRQLGRLFDHIQSAGLAKQTVIVVCADNGPTAWPRYQNGGFAAPGWTGGLRGRKWSLYEGGIREPLIVSWPGTIDAGQVDRTSLINAVDFFPTFCQLAGIATPHIEFDGIDFSKALLGVSLKRKKPMFWEYGRNASYLKPSEAIDRSPVLAVRDGDWKLLMNADGTDKQLYNLSQSIREDHNLCSQFPRTARRLTNQLNSWKDELPNYPK
jgi:arylsulfatase A-like enzyme